MRDRGLDGAEPAAVGEAVRRHVDDPHDARAVERQPGEARARGAERLHEVGRLQRVASPLALEGFPQCSNAPAHAEAVALDDLDCGKAQRLSGERQPAPDVLAIISGRGENADGADVDRALHQF